MRWLLGVVLMIGVAEASPIYRVIDLGTPGGTSSHGTSVSESGVAGGWGLDGASAERGFVGGTVTGGGVQNHVNGVNNSGQAVGVTYLGGTSQATVWQGGQGQSIGGAESEATAINNNGQVTGAQGGQAFRYSNGAMQTVGSGIGQSTGYAIDSKGNIAGTTLDAWGMFRAFYWGANGTVATLGTLGGRNSYGFGINDLGDVVGSAAIGSGYLHAAIWTGGAGAREIGTLGGNMSGAYDINDLGQVVGYSLLGSGESAAFLWAGGGLMDLNYAIDPQSGWRLLEALAINNNGQIVGTGMYNGATRAFLLDPFGGAFFADSQAWVGPVTAAPEPGSLGLVAGGLLLAGAAWRRARGKVK